MIAAAETPALLPVPFHGDTVQLANHEGQPVVPARPIVENLGLDWKSQHRKLVSERKRWSVAGMTTVGQDGRSREMLCLPLRKLPAFLMSIHPSKVKPAIRPKLELYQAECDEVLWQYWTYGQAGRPSAVQAQAVPLEKYVTLLEEHIALLRAGKPKTARTGRRKPRPLTPEDIAEIQRLHAEGLGISEIARRVERNSSSVHWIVRDLNAGRN